MRVFFTLPHNNPSGGVKVVNEYCQLLNSKGVESYICLPEAQNQRATFLPNPAPIISLKDMTKESTLSDVIILCWQSCDEYSALKSAKALKKIFWQHGILTPIGKQNVGDLILTEKRFDEYWNVSKACGQFIAERYNFKRYKVLSPFVVPSSNIPRIDQKNGFITLARRGSSQLGAIKDLLKRLDQSLTILEGNFESQHFLRILAHHKFYISIDNGIKDNTNYLNPFKKKKWKFFSQNLLGFPVPPLEAMSLGTITVGYAMGGGLEYMNEKNSLIAKDDNLENLLGNIESAIKLNRSQHESMVNNAIQTSLLFNPEAAFNNFLKLLDIKL